ncbi:WbnE [Acinetobacter baumannii]|uniref:glycosyltransferase family 4 protein n=1 Tax=Acinetobacter baumannii TaxID=470 RepID=UPI000DE705E5|nr:glycosyltransferase family 4 protein [Acinetobacter baumannii]MCJ9202301.1 glycosyltransferase family 4 protein [Acinetobacter baumannii]MCJ9352250.1 glycosyltransferase family 4 protein [Acinetobacter baumannii]MDN8253635.1 glycosyltransferase family 4 protein [Acinetobacter baumannii]MDQ8938987.1 glycosyltransferase family 4 protein [Acinetobacter baumannii]MDQ9850086.1 glycosyltransferase family 4 protein [Acinetobacter baumannii]
MKLSKKVVLIGTTGSSFYGFRADLILRLVKQGHIVYALTSESTEQCLVRIKALGAIPIMYELSRGGLNPFADIQSFLQLKSILKAIKPDIVLSYFAKPVIYGSMAAKSAKVPVIIGMLEGLGYTFTEQPEGQNIKTKVIRSIQVLLYKMSFPCLNKIIFLNQDDRNDLIKKYSLNVPEVHILGGIGLNLSDYPFMDAKISPVKFLFIGRLLKEKGVFELIQAIRIVKSKYPQAHFTILGAIDHQNMGALKQSELDELIAEKLFEYPGYVTNVNQWITDSSVFVLPSYREGVPRSTQEAMAIGRPVITTDVPGCRETVENGVNGFLVPKWDPEALAEKMCYFIENPEQVNIMGLKSYEIAQEKFDAEKVNAKLIDIMGLKDLNEKTS